MERKYKILKILYCVIRVHRFEYHFVVFVCALRLTLHKVALYTLVLNFLFPFTSSPFSTLPPTPFASPFSLIRDSVFVGCVRRCAGIDRHGVVVHRCTQNAICVFGCASATIQHPVENENGLCVWCWCAERNAKSYIFAYIVIAFMIRAPNRMQHIEMT